MKHDLTELGLAPPAQSAMHISAMTTGDAGMAARWDQFVMDCPEATFFHRAGWQRIIEGVFRHPTKFLYAECNGRIEGVLPLAHVRSRLFGNALISLPFAVYGGVAATTREAATALEDRAQALAQQLGVDHLELRSISARHADWPTQDIYVRFRKALLPDVDANLLAIPRKQRAMVRKGIKHGLRSAWDDDVDRFFALYADNMHRHGTPAQPKRYFEALRQEFRQDCDVLTVTDSGGRPLSSVLSFYFRGDVMPYYAGDDVAARDLAANDFKYWELMRRACERGLGGFDYGRSKRGTGPFAFKQNWGFEPQPLHYEYRLYHGDGIPQNNPANPKYRLFIALWRRLPLSVATALGPRLARNLG